MQALTALTVFRLRETARNLLATMALLRRIDESIRRVFEIYPVADPVYLKKAQEFARKKQQLLSPKPLFVFVSSNKEMFGDLMTDVAKLFIEDLAKTDNDALVIGKIGKYLLEKANLQRSNITYFELDDDRPELPTLQKIVAILEQYDRVVVYYAKNENPFRQIPTRGAVMRQFPNMVKPAKKYFFEPTPEEVLDFLQTQISINSFHQKIYEAQIARLSARRWIWTKQQLARSQILVELKREYKKYKRGVLQKQQMVTVTAHRLTREL